MTTLKHEVRNVSPSLATEWLKTSGINRKVNQANVARLRTDMEHGAWRETGDPIRFDKRGRLRDGQHRLTALVEAGVSLPFHIVHGLEEDAVTAVDTGRARNFADVLTMKGKGEVPASLARKVAAVAKLIWHYENGTILASGQAVSHAELEGVLKRHKGLPDLVEHVAAEPKIQPHAQIGLVYCLAAEGKPRKAKQWLERLQTGESLRRGHPIYEARELLTTKKGHGGKMQARGPYIGALMAKSWNAYLADEKSVELTFRHGVKNAEEPFPIIG